MLEQRSIAKSKRKNLTSSEKRHILNELLKLSVNGKLPHGAKQDLARKLSIDRRHVSNVWHAYEKSEADNTELKLHSGRKGHSGRKPIDTAEIRSRLSNIPFNERRTVRSLAESLSMPTSTVHKNMDALTISKRASWLKPTLSTHQKLNRIRWVFDWIIENRNGNKMFQTFQNVIHIDEKWFHLCKDGEKCYIMEDERAPQRNVPHKSHIKKVMFLAAVGRPQWDATKKKLFDGKIGCWPFQEEVVAKRSSKNRPAGTVEIVPVSATRETYKKLILHSVIPEIRKRFPRKKGQVIYIQQDNATPIAFGWIQM